MESNFNKAFADFLEEQTGEAVAKLREGNEKYRILLQERENLIKTEYQDLLTQKQGFERFIEVAQAINEIESHFLLLTGMRLQRQIYDALVTEDFYTEFIG